VLIDRMSRWLQRYDSGTLSLVFTAQEIDTCRRSAHSARCLASCFAGKEAVGKALGVGLEGMRWHEIEIAHERPAGHRLTVTLRSEARRVSLARGIVRWRVTAIRRGRLQMVYVLGEGKGHIQ